MHARSSSRSSLMDLGRSMRQVFVARKGGGGGGLGGLSAAGAAWAALNVTLGVIVVTALQAVSAAELELFLLYYQPFAPMLLMLWLWAVAVRLFERRYIRYQVCFSGEDQRFLLRSHQLFQVRGGCAGRQQLLHQQQQQHVHPALPSSLSPRAPPSPPTPPSQLCNVLTALLLGSAALFLRLCAAGNPQAASYHPPALYLGLLAFLLFPGNMLARDSRHFFASTLWRVVTPIRGVTFADFLLADVLTSLAKALSDTERAVCHLMTGPVMTPHWEKVCAAWAACRGRACVCVCVCG